MLEFEKISIIMAAYNAEKTIECAIRSVLEQTFDHWELLVVDDGSTDSTPEIVADFSKKDWRVRLIRNNQNRGVSYSRKHGLREADGSWIAILDSDDAWQQTKLEKQIRLQKETNADLIFTGSAFMNEDGALLSWEMQVPGKVTYRQLLKQNVISNSSALVRKDLYARHYASGDQMHEDFATWLQILHSGRIAYGINEPLLIYRISTSSKTSNKLKAAKMNWRTYRFIGLNLIQSIYCEVCYTVNGLKKYRNIK